MILGRMRSFRKTLQKWHLGKEVEGYQESQANQHERDVCYTCSPVWACHTNDVHRQNVSSQQIGNYLRVRKACMILFKVIELATLNSILKLVGAVSIRRWLSWKQEIAWCDVVEKQGSPPTAQRFPSTWQRFYSCFPWKLSSKMPLEDVQPRK